MESFSKKLFYLILIILFLFGCYLLILSNKSEYSSEESIKYEEIKKDELEKILSEQNKSKRHLSTINSRLGDSIFFGFRENMHPEEVEAEIKYMVDRHLLKIEISRYRGLQTIFFRMILGDYYLEPEVEFIYTNHSNIKQLKRIQLDFDKTHTKKFNLNYSQNHSINPKQEINDLVKLFNKRYNSKKRINSKKKVILNWKKGNRSVDFHYYPKFHNILEDEYLGFELLILFESVKYKEETKKELDRIYLESQKKNKLEQLENESNSKKNFNEILKDM